MNDTWVVVAHRGGARLLEVGSDDKLRVFETLVGAPRSSGHDNSHDEPRESQRDHPERVFAAEVAEFLRHGRVENRFKELVLIAAPRFLGFLRDALDAATATTVRGTLDKDYAGLNDRELVQRLEKM